MLSATDWEDRTTSYEYNKNSQLTKTTRPDGTIEVRTYDKAGNLTAIKDKRNNTIINYYEYNYDSVGNIISVTSNSSKVDNRETR